MISFSAARYKNLPGRSLGRFLLFYSQLTCREEIGAQHRSNPYFAVSLSGCDGFPLHPLLYGELCMILWTIQHEEAYLWMVRNGVLRADRAHLFGGDDFLVSYNWMSQQMRMRISEPPMACRTLCGFGIPGRANANARICGGPHMRRPTPRSSC